MDPEQPPNAIKVVSHTLKDGTCIESESFQFEESENVPKQPPLYFRFLVVQNIIRLEFESKNGIKKSPSPNNLVFKEISGFNRYKLEFSEHQDNAFFNVLQAADPDLVLQNSIGFMFGSETKIQEFLIEGEFDPIMNHFIGKIKVKSFDGSVGIMEGDFKNLKLEGKGCRVEVSKQNQEKGGSISRHLVQGEFKNGIGADFKSENFDKNDQLVGVFQGKVLQNVDKENSDYKIEGQKTTIDQSEDTQWTVCGFFDQNWSPIGKSRCEWDLNAQDMKLISQGVHTPSGRYDPNQDCIVQYRSSRVAILRLKQRQRQTQKEIKLRPGRITIAQEMLYRRQEIIQVRKH